MTDILERAQQLQRDCAQSTLVSIRLTLLQDMITEIERLRVQVGPTTLKAIASRLEERK